MIIGHYSEAEWDTVRWPNFSPAELSCNCCGEMYWDEEAFDAIQFMRSTVGNPLVINSAHRCALHNAKVGGAPLSQHKKVAFDVAIGRHDISQLLNAARMAGFTGFGYYGTFLHVDLGRPRFWFSKSGEQVWSSLVTS